jgi:hypothetical protein
MTTRIEQTFYGQAADASPDNHYTNRTRVLASRLHEIEVGSFLDDYTKSVDYTKKMSIPVSAIEQIVKKSRDFIEKFKLFKVRFKDS